MPERDDASLTAWDRPAVVLVTGIQAAGKTTVGRLLADKLPRSAFVDGDVLARMVVGGHEPMSREPPEEAIRQLHLRYQQAALVANSFWRANFTAIIADNIYGRDELLGFVDQVKADPFIVVMLSPQSRSVIERECARGSRAYEGWMRHGGLEAAVAEFQGYLADTPRLGLWLDTTGQTPDATVAAIMDRAWTEGRIR